jgi:hypothetical protein
MQVLNETERHNPLEDDIVALMYTSKKLLALEPELFRSKWFDYRMMTPVQATRLYIQAFTEVYRAFYAAQVDRKTASFVRPPSVESIFSGLANNDAKAKGLFAACYRGRQVADALGMPYREYIHTTMGRRLRFWNQKHLPRPHHLYGSFDVEHTQAQWEEMQTTKLYLSEDPCYMIQNYRSIAHQDDYHDWLFKQAGLRANPPMYLAQFVNDDVLPLSKVEARYEPEQVQRVYTYLQ